MLATVCHPNRIQSACGSHGQSLQERLWNSHRYEFQHGNTEYQQDRADDAFE